MDSIAHAADVIRRGGLVAFPTETVYGLGADAFNPIAVSKIYSVKGRPPDNPLILHAENAAAVNGVAQDINSTARRLMEEYWPGPLTLVFKKKENLPSWVGGHPDGTTGTVAVRVPANPIALALIKASGCMIAAPSANKAGRPSPTRASHVLADYGDKSGIDYILDGGETERGLESTVVDVTTDTPRILRPGAVTREMMEAALGITLTEAGTDSGQDDGQPLSPGMKYKHYAPKAPLTLVCGPAEQAVAYILERIASAGYDKRKRIGVLATEETEARYRDYYGNGKVMFARAGDIIVLNSGSRAAPDTIAHNLYNCLRRFDELQADIIYAEGVDESGLGQAIMNRLKKASGGRIVCVS